MERIVELPEQKCAVDSLVFIIMIVWITNFSLIALLWSLFSLVCVSKNPELKTRTVINFFEGFCAKSIKECQKIKEQHARKYQ